MCVQRDTHHAEEVGIKALCLDFHSVICVSLEFEEPRVIDLWDMAKSANFTEKELESFRVSRISYGKLFSHLNVLCYS